MKLLKWLLMFDDDEKKPIGTLKNFPEYLRTKIRLIIITAERRSWRLNKKYLAYFSNYPLLKY